MLAQLSAFGAWLAPIVVGVVLHAVKSNVRKWLKGRRILGRAVRKLRDPSDTNDPREAVVSAVVEENRPAIVTMTQRVRRYSTPPTPDPRTNGDHKSGPVKR